MIQTPSELKVLENAHARADKHTRVYRLFCATAENMVESAIMSGMQSGEITAREGGWFRTGKLPYAERLNKFDKASFYTHLWQKFESRSWKLRNLGYWNNKGEVYIEARILPKRG